MGIHHDELAHNPGVFRRRNQGIDRLLFQLGIVLAFLSAISAVLWLRDGEYSMPAWLWISPAILFVACAGTAFRIIHADIQMAASPVFWVLLASAVYWGFGPLVLTFGNEITLAQIDSGFYVGPTGLMRTNLLDSVGMLVIVAGLALGRHLVGKRPHGWTQHLEGMNALRVAVALAAVGLSAKFAMVLPRVFDLIETQSSTLMHLETFTKAALMILAYLSATKGRQATFLFALLFTVEILASGLLGSKMAILEVIIVTLVGRTLAVQRTSTMIKGFLVLGLLHVFLQPVVSAYRVMDKSTGEAYSTSVVEAGSLMLQSISDLIHGCNTSQEDYPQSWWHRLCYAQQQAFSMQEYDAGRPGSPWEDVAASIVPRVFWPDKPWVTPGVNFSILYDGNASNNNGPGVIGEGYWYGGWLGVVSVCLYTGVFLGGIDRISHAVLSHRVWIAMPLVFFGIKTGFRIDGWFSLEYMFGSFWYLLFVISILSFVTISSTWVQRDSRLTSS